MTKLTSKLAVVIPVHNRVGYTRSCLASLRNQTVQPDNIIIVDDGSSDGTHEFLQKEFPEVSVIRGDGTLFWTAAINKGIRQALDEGSDHILTLNNDTVASKDFVEKMLWAAKQRPNALLGCLDIDARSQRPYYGGEIFNWRSSQSTFLLDVLKAEDQRGLHEVTLLPARGLLIPRVVFETIGLFEEKQLPHYMADYDFTLMAARHGFRIFCNYEAKLYTYPDESGDHKIRKAKNLRNYFKHLFDIRGGGNLLNYAVYTFRNCPRNLILPALFTGFARRIGGFWLK